MPKATTLTETESRQMLADSLFRTLKQFEMVQRMAQMFVQSDLVPQSYRGNIGNCAIAVDMALRMNAAPLFVMQNLYLVHGQPSWSSKFLVGCINTCGRYGSMRYEFVGTKGKPDYGCYAVNYELSRPDKPLKGAVITMEMATREGWTSKNGSKWATMPEQMLMYRAAAFWCRVYAPEVSLGFATREEIEDGAYDSVPAARRAGSFADADATTEEAPALSAQTAPELPAAGNRRRVIRVPSKLNAEVDRMEAEEAAALQAATQQEEEATQAVEAPTANDPGATILDIMQQGGYATHAARRVRERAASAPDNPDLDELPFA